MSDFIIGDMFHISRKKKSWLTNSFQWAILLKTFNFKNSVLAKHKLPAFLKRFCLSTQVTLVTVFVTELTILNF